MVRDQTPSRDPWPWVSLSSPGLSEGHPPILRLGAQRQVGTLESVPIPVCIPVPILGPYPRSAFQVYIPSVVLQENAVGSAVGCRNPQPRELAFSHFL